MKRLLPLFALCGLCGMGALPAGCGTTTTSVGSAASDAGPTEGGGSADASETKCCPTTTPKTGCRAVGGVNTGTSACVEVCNLGSTYGWTAGVQQGCPVYTYAKRPETFTCGELACVSTASAPTYCHATVSTQSGVTTAYACRAVPAQCINDQSCTCIMNVEQPAPTSCQETNGIANAILEVP